MSGRSFGRLLGMTLVSLALTALAAGLVPGADGVLLDYEWAKQFDYEWAKQFDYEWAASTLPVTIR